MPRAPGSEDVAKRTRRTGWPPSRRRRARLAARLEIGNSVGVVPRSRPDAPFGVGGQRTGAKASVSGQAGAGRRGEGDPSLGRRPGDHGLATGSARSRANAATRASAQGAQMSAWSRSPCAGSPSPRRACAPPKTPNLMPRSRARFARRTAVAIGPRMRQGKADLPPGAGSRSRLRVPTERGPLRPRDLTRVRRCLILGPPTTTEDMEHLGICPLKVRRAAFAEHAMGYRGRL